MARHVANTKHTRAESRAERDHRTLAQAKSAALRQIRSANIPRDSKADTEGEREIVSTLNWETENGSPLCPRLLRAEEWPELASPSLRLLVNLTAEGSPTPIELHRALLQEAPERLAEAITEGIRRWHTYPQKRT